MTDYTDFRNRITRSDVRVIALNKRSGQDWPTYRRLYRLLRELRPDILHTRTWSSLEGQFYGALARVPGRVHGEHGASMEDCGSGWFRRSLVRRAINPFVDQYTAVSADLARRLVRVTGISPNRVAETYNGVDTARFHPRCGLRGSFGPPGFAPENVLVVGTVGRMQPVKNQLSLVQAFLRALEGVPDARSRLRLVLVGDGPLRQSALDMIQAAGAASLAWLPGERDDIPDILRKLDLFVLPSLAEGMSNTILEAMASGLPVLATCIAGNLELVEPGRTGTLVPAGDVDSMAAALHAYLDDPAKLVSQGCVARQTAEARFSLEAMVSRYLEVYDGVLTKKGRRITS